VKVPQRGELRALLLRIIVAHDLRFVIRGALVFATFRLPGQKVAKAVKSIGRAEGLLVGGVDKTDHEDVRADPFGHAFAAVGGILDDAAERVGFVVQPLNDRLPREAALAFVTPGPGEAVFRERGIEEGGGRFAERVFNVLIEDDERSLGRGSRECR
jgi:hypothetical protein